MSSNSTCSIWYSNACFRDFQSRLPCPLNAFPLFAEFIFYRIATETQLRFWPDDVIAKPCVLKLTFKIRTSWRLSSSTSNNRIHIFTLNLCINAFENIKLFFSTFIQRFWRLRNNKSVHNTYPLSPFLLFELEPRAFNKSCSWRMKIGCDALWNHKCRAYIGQMRLKFPNVHSYVASYLVIP